MRRVSLLALIVIVLVADQATKAFVRASLPREEPRRYGVLTLLHTENRGAFLSLGSNLPQDVRVTIFDGFVAFALIVAAVMLFRGMLELGGDRIAVALLVAGGLGNLIDRIRFRGLVTDFLLLSAGPLHTGVFNVADMAVTAGVTWLIASWIASRTRRV